LKMIFPQTDQCQLILHSGLVEPYFKRALGIPPTRKYIFKLHSAMKNVSIAIMFFKFTRKVVFKIERTIFKSAMLARRSETVI